jgi:hypothetical protein
LAVGVLVASPLAHAQGVDEFGAYGRPQDATDYESPQKGAFELRLGPYYPEVDDEFHGTATPLADSLGTSKRILLGVEGDWQALRVHRLLSLGPGFGMGYTALSKAASYVSVGPGGEQLPEDVSGGASSSPMDSSLKLWLQWADAVVRVDALDRRFGVPLVFTAKVGLAHAMWWAGKGNLAGHDANGVIGHGRSWGPTWALGIMFDLNFMQQARARQLDSVWGINHQYVFAEWYQFKLNGFGSGNQMQVGDSTWALGYALEF